jgi:23S rRNA (uracil1939-C5)-methyltransferase
VANKTTVKNMSHGAFAIAQSDEGKTIFIENACPGDVLEYEIYDDRKNFSYASVKNLIEESSSRAKDPKCKVHKICGSCQWQHIDYQKQLDYKKQNLIDLIKETKIETKLDIPDLIGMNDPWNYRNKIIYPVDTVPSTGRLLAGYFKRNSNELINIKYCPIQYSIFDEIIEKLKELASENSISKSFLRHILVRSNVNHSQLLVSLIVRKKELEDKKYHKLKKTLKGISEAFPQVVTTTINYNDNSTNVIMGSETELVTGQGYIEEEFSGIKLKLSTESFFQVNTEQFSKIIDFITKEVKTGEKLLDAYCGIGTISLSLAKRISDLSITGVEIVEAAIANARENALENDIEADFHCGRMEDKIEDFKDQDFDTLIINPPRKGCTNKVLDALGKIKAKKIIYVSCNPSTITRDIKYLEAFNFKLEKIQAFDMFPHSFHFETVAILKT